MDANQLRELQGPLKQRYREHPDTARVSARSEGRLDLTHLTCAVQTWRGATIAGLHPATGGSGEFACSADMVLDALVACAGVTLAAVASAMGLELRGAKIIAEGSWDARGTLALDKTVPIGLTDVALRFELDTDAAPEKIERLIASTERYCVIFQTLRSPPRLAVSHTTGTPQSP
jgi:uncharacterized OsmC-like protein